MRLCRSLEDLNLLFVEEPVPPENVDELCMVQRETTIPIAAGERWATIYGVRAFLEKHAVDYLQCDLVNCGGITGLKRSRQWRRLTISAWRRTIRTDH